MYRFVDQYTGAGELNSTNCTCGGYIPVGSGVKKRKPRSDKGKKRQPNNWMKMVKGVAKEYNLPYNQALKKANQLKKDGYVSKDFV